MTDATDGTVGVFDTAHNLIRTISLPGGSNPTDITVSRDGTVFVAYTGTNGAAIAVISAVPVVGLDPTALGETIAGLPAGLGLSSGLVVVGDVTYQTVIGTDPVTGKSTTTVAVIAADGTTTLSHADGIAAGSVVVGPNGVVYQAISNQYDTTDAALTGC